MVHKNIYKKKARAQITLAWMWVVITALVLMFIAFLTWTYHQSKHSSYFNNTAREIRLNLDDTIDDINRVMVASHFSKKDYQICSPEHVLQMKKLTFDDPELSGIYMADKDFKIICSTMDDGQAMAPVQLVKSPAIFGPFDNHKLNKPYFIIQQAVGDHYVGFYILRSVLENKMRLFSDYIGKVILLDLAQKKPLIVIDSTKKTSKKGPLHYKLENMMTNKNADKAISHLQTLEGVSIIIESNKNFIIKHMLQTELFIACLVLFFTTLLYLQLRKILSQRYSLTGALRHAIKSSQFFPIYQPIYDPLKEKYVGAEVLVRWHSDDNEPIQPDFFIDEAEASGLIVPITSSLIKKAFVECGELLKQNKDFHLAFNVSRDHFVDKDFINDFLYLCDKKQINPQQIILELTERQLLDLNDKKINTKVQQLRKKGFSLAIDDYGTGHSSISYLQSFPFNYLKIDKIYTQSIGSGAITESLIETIIEMARKLKLVIIAEGVETHQQLDYLIEHKVQLIQGWLFAKAMPVDELIDYIERS